jgi:ubiquitin carboxyl-terminal hydrolase 7
LERTSGPIFDELLKGFQGETFSETKKRLEKRTGIKGKSFEKIKFAVVRRSQFSRPQYLVDGKPEFKLVLSANRY